MQYEEKPIPLAAQEYLYLTETLEPMSRAQLADGMAARFVVQSREQTLRQVVRMVFQTELNETERTVAMLLLLEQESVCAAARRLELPRSRVYASADSAKKKLTAYLKYPFLLDFNLLEPRRTFAEALKQYGGIR